jgi:hypothetical protein
MRKNYFTQCKRTPHWCFPIQEIIHFVMHLLRTLIFIVNKYTCRPFPHKNQTLMYKNCLHRSSYGLIVYAYLQRSETYELSFFISKFQPLSLHGKSEEYSGTYMDNFVTHRFLLSKLCITKLIPKSHSELNIKIFIPICKFNALDIKQYAIPCTILNILFLKFVHSLLSFFRYSDCTDHLKLFMSQEYQAFTWQNQRNFRFLELNRCQICQA